MKKKYILGALMISAGLSLIFGYAAHNWLGGLIVGVCFFIVSLLIMEFKNKKDKE